MDHEGEEFEEVHFDDDEEEPMDSDGEDDPSVIKKLLETQQENKTNIINVSRGKRSESIVFKFLYAFYKLIFRIITKSRMNFGNFCLIDRGVHEGLANSSFIHLAAKLSKLNAKRSFIVADRTPRLSGKSKMNISSLTHHAFKSFIEYSEQSLMVFFRLFIIVTFVLMGVGGYILFMKLFTEKAISGWASTLGASLFNTALLCMGFFVMGLLLINILNKQNTVNRTDVFKEVHNK